MEAIDIDNMQIRFIGRKKKEEQSEAPSAEKNIEFLCTDEGPGMDAVFSQITVVEEKKGKRKRRRQVVA